MLTKIYQRKNLTKNYKYHLLSKQKKILLWKRNVMTQMTKWKSTQVQKNKTSNSPKFFHFSHFSSKFQQITNTKWWRWWNGIRRDWYIIRKNSSIQQRINNVKIFGVLNSIQQIRHSSKISVVEKKTKTRTKKLVSFSNKKKK